jgi:hypothetical protein
MPDMEGRPDADIAASAWDLHQVNCTSAFDMALHGLVFTYLSIV